MHILLLLHLQLCQLQQARTRADAEGAELIDCTLLQLQQRIARLAEDARKEEG